MPDPENVTDAVKFLAGEGWFVREPDRCLDNTPTVGSHWRAINKSGQEDRFVIVGHFYDAHGHLLIALHEHGDNQPVYMRLNHFLVGATKCEIE